jgi:predicted Fe-Mo cluster-binding NifX family protein
MGAGSYEGMKQANIHPVVADVADIDEAVQTYLAGSLKDHVEKLH